MENSSEFTGFSLSNGELQYGRPVLHEVPCYVKMFSHADISSTEPPLSCTYSSSEGAFIGFDADAPAHTHIFSMGKLKNTRFSSIFKFKLWWTTHWVGNNGSDIERETQILILDTHTKAQLDGVSDYPYIIFLPIIEGKFRASLQGGMNDYVDVCVESGSTLVCEREFKSCVYVHASKDPFVLVKNALKAVEAHLGTFKMLEEKVVPSIVNAFGWCTWDAFYLGVHPEGVRDGIEALVEGGVPPKFLIIDDGWQSIAFDHQDPLQDATQQAVAGDQMRCRLTRIPANSKFSNYTRGSLFDNEFNEDGVSLDSVVKGSVGASSRGCANIIDVAREHLDACDTFKGEGTMTDSHACHSIIDGGARKRSNACQNIKDGGACHSILGKGTRTGSHACDGITHGGEARMGPHACCSILDKGASLGSHAFPSDLEQVCLISGGCYPKSINNCALNIEYNPEERDNKGLKAFISDLKRKYTSLDDVYMWHALVGYWGGVRPGMDDSFGAELVKPVLAAGVSETMEDLALDKIVSNYIGLVPPENASKFYDNMHSYLVQSGVSGVKLDVIQVLELLGEKNGGRVELCKSYYKGLDESVTKNLGDNRVIASMEHSNDFMLLGTQHLALGRVGDDFWPEDVDGNPLLWLQGFHMVHCAYNSLWLGQAIHPDWDMFQTMHPCAAFHAASRAISGGPVYISDKPGHHDFTLLKRMVFPDGTIPRCERFALPTRDCLFLNPMNDGMTVLKIWNLNKCGGVIGVFNCQGGGWSRELRTTMPSSTRPTAYFTSVSPNDIEWTPTFENSDSFACYSMKLDNITILKKSESLNVKVEPTDYDIFTLCALQIMAENLSFAPIGLTDMLNSGGSIESVGVGPSDNCAIVKVRGAGRFCAYASFHPIFCKLDHMLVDFSYNSSGRRVTVEIPWKGDVSTLEFVFYT